MKPELHNMHHLIYLKYIFMDILIELFITIDKLYVFTWYKKEVFLDNFFRFGRVRIFRIIVISPFFALPLMKGV